MLEVMQNINERLGRLSLLFPIVGAQARRIGILRVVVGGVPMYISIPIIVLLYSSMALFQKLLTPIFATENLKWRDYVVIDRHRIRELSWLDRLNCQFCGYAVGIATLINVELDNISRHPVELRPLKKMWFAIVGSIYLPFLLFSELNIQVVYNLMVSRPLGMHRVSIRQAASVIADNEYANHHKGFVRVWIRIAKNQAMRFFMLLEQVESAFCPLVHFEKREGVVYPEYHQRFFGPEEIEEMTMTLATVGTVSERRPKY